MDARLRLAGDALHIGAEQCIRAGAAEHDGGRRLAAARDEGGGGLWDAREVAARHDVAFVHLVEREAFPVAAGAGERRCIAAAARR